MGKWVAYQSIYPEHWFAAIPDEDNDSWNETLKYFGSWREAFDHAFKEASK